MRSVASLVFVFICVSVFLVAAYADAEASKLDIVWKQPITPTPNIRITVWDEQECIVIGGRHDFFCIDKNGQLLGSLEVHQPDLFWKNGISTRDRFYIGTFNGRLLGLDRQANVCWSHNAATLEEQVNISCQPFVCDNRIYFALIHGKIVEYDPASSGIRPFYLRNPEHPNPVITSITVSSEGKIFLSDTMGGHSLDCYSLEGELEWSVATPAIHSIQALPDGNILVKTVTGHSSIYSPEGNELVRIKGRISLGSNQDMFSSTGNKLLALDQLGQVRWEREFDCDWLSCFVEQNGTIYCQTRRPDVIGGFKYRTREKLVREWFRSLDEEMQNKIVSLKLEAIEKLPGPRYTSWLYKISKEGEIETKYQLPPGEYMVRAMLGSGEFIASFDPDGGYDWDDQSNYTSIVCLRISE